MWPDFGKPTKFPHLIFQEIPISNIQWFVCAQWYIYLHDAYVTTTGLNSNSTSQNLQGNFHCSWTIFMQDINPFKDSMNTFTNMLITCKRLDFMVWIQRKIFQFKYQWYTVISISAVVWFYDFKIDFKQGQNIRYHWVLQLSYFI